MIASLPRQWQCRSRKLFLGERTLVMGILNVTPDSFSDAGEYFDPQHAVERAWEIVHEGADILDIGAMSSRPGSEEIAESEELSRLMPVLERLGGAYPLPISVDTWREKVARESLLRGAVIINDITGLRGDSKLKQTIAEYQAGLILMHLRGTPRTMQRDTHYDDLQGEITRFLEQQCREALSAGIAWNQLVLDPGIGFGKSLEGNLELIRSSGRFRLDSAGVLVGVSRKSFIGAVLDRPPKERVWGTAAAVALAIEAGADIIRVHDVAAMRDVCRMADALVRSR